MWDLPGPGLEPMSPALAGRFLTTAPPGKSKRKEILTHATTWMNLEGVMSQKDKYCMIPLV